jgi:spore coat protein U-like protein
MHAGPGKTVDYGLYSDPGRALPWGTDEDSIVPGTGNGVEDAYPVYGRIPPQAAAPGSYSDTVVVTITY